LGTADVAAASMSSDHALARAMAEGVASAAKTKADLKTGLWAVAQALRSQPSTEQGVRAPKAGLTSLPSVSTAKSLQFELSKFADENFGTLAKAMTTFRPLLKASGKDGCSLAARIDKVNKAASYDWHQLIIDKQLITDLRGHLHSHWGDQKLAPCEGSEVGEAPCEGSSTEPEEESGKGHCGADAAAEAVKDKLDEALNNLRQAERSCGQLELQIAELKRAQDESASQMAAMQLAGDAVQAKVAKYEKQIEDSVEEIAELKKLREATQEATRSHLSTKDAEIEKLRTKMTKKEYEHIKEMEQALECASNLVSSRDKATGKRHGGKWKG